MDFLAVIATMLAVFLGLLASVLVILFARLMLQRERSPVPPKTAPVRTTYL